MMASALNKIGVVGAFALLVALGGCSQGEQSDNSKSASPAARGQVAVGSDSEACRPATGALGWLPVDSLLVLRAPALSNFASFGETALGESLAKLELGDLLSKLSDFKAKLVKDEPELLPVLDVVCGLRGEVLFGVSDLSLGALAQGKRGMPVTAELHVQLGTKEAEVLAMLKAAVEKHGRQARMESLGEGAYRSVTPMGTVGVLVDAGYLSFAFSSNPDIIQQLRERRQLKLADSFLASSVLKGSPGLAGNEVRYSEAYVNLEPLWPLAKSFAPSEVKQMLSQLRLAELQGISAVSSVKGREFRDLITIHMASHGNLVGQLLDQPAIQTHFARSVFPGADTACIASVDLVGVLKKVRAALPSRLRSQLDSELRQAKSRTGLKIEEDVLAAFGPHLSIALEGDPITGWIKDRETKVGLVIEVAKASKADAVMKVALKAMGRALQPISVNIPGVRAYSAARMSRDGPSWFSPCFALTPTALVVASSEATLNHILDTRSAGKSSKLLSDSSLFAGAPTVVAVRSGEEWSRSVRDLAGAIDKLMSELKEVPELMPVALAPANGVSFADRLAAAISDWPDSRTAFRKTANGFVLDSTGPLPSVTSGAAPLAVIAAIGIPNLVSARAKANNSAAIATLRNLGSAQEQFRAMACVDRNGDEMGEYGFMGELSGLTPLSNGKPLDPPMVSRAFQKIESGVVTRSGFHFKVYLPSKAGGIQAESADGAANPSLPKSTGSTGYVIYAWPAKDGGSSSRTYVIDQSGDIYAQDPERSEPYVGMDQAPPATAAYPKGGFGKGSASPERRGADGGLWLKLR